MEYYSDEGYKLYFGKFFHRLAAMIQIEAKGKTSDAQQKAG
jgi:hypothetical protein